MIGGMNDRTTDVVQRAMEIKKRALRQANRAVRPYRQELLACSIGLLMAVAGGYLLYREGVSAGRTDAKLEQLAQALEANAVVVSRARSIATSATHAASIEADRSVSRRRLAGVARRKVDLRGDTAVVGDSTRQVILPELSELIRTSDALHVQDSITILVQAIAIASQDSLIRSLDRRVEILEEENGVLRKATRPRFGFRAGAIAAAITIAVLAGAVR